MTPPSYEDFRRGGSERDLRDSAGRTQLAIRDLLERLGELEGAVCAAERDGVPIATRGESLRLELAQIRRALTAGQGVIADVTRERARCAGAGCARPARNFWGTRGGWFCDECLAEAGRES